jgi:hypothetical protein
LVGWSEIFLLRHTLKEGLSGSIIGLCIGLSTLILSLLINYRGSFTLSALI